MNLREEILKEHSKAQCNKIVNWVGKSQSRFDRLFDLFLNDVYRVNQRAAWPVSYCVIGNPKFIQKHFGPLLKNLDKEGLHDSVKRNTVRLLQHVNVPKKFHGKLMDTCFRFLENPNEALAIKVFSMTVLDKLAKIYPEIFPELKLIIEEQLPRQTVAFKGKAALILGHKVIKS